METFITAAIAKELKLVERFDFRGGREPFFLFHIGHSDIVTRLYRSRASRHIPQNGSTDIQAKQGAHFSPYHNLVVES